MDTALADLGWEAEGAPVDGPPRRIGVGELPGGWVLFLFDRDLKQAFQPQIVEEHVMVQETRGDSNGAETWRVTHDPNKASSFYHLEVSGDPPASLKRIHEAAIAQQDEEGGEEADVDVIADARLLVAKDICGFKHDDAWPLGLAFREVRRGSAARGGGSGGLFSRLFGRR